MKSSALSDSLLKPELIGLCHSFLVEKWDNNDSEIFIEPDRQTFIERGFSQLVYKAIIAGFLIDEIGLDDSCSDSFNI